MDKGELGSIMPSYQMPCKKQGIFVINNLDRRVLIKYADYSTDEALIHIRYHNPNQNGDFFFRTILIRLTFLI